MSFSDRVDFQLVDDILKEYTVEQGFQAGETLDQLTREELAGGSNVFYANGRTSRATLVAGDKFTIADARKIVRSFEKNKVKPFADGNYVCFVSPDTKMDIISDPDWQKIQQYGMTSQKLVDNDMGVAFSVRYIMTPNAKVFTAAGGGAPAADVHAAIFLGQNAYGITTINGEGDVKAIIKALGSAGTADPLNQQQTIGWKVNAFVAKRLQEQAIYRYEHVPTA